MNGNDFGFCGEVFVVGFAVGAATASLLWWFADLFLKESE